MFCIWRRNHRYRYQSNTVYRNSKTDCTYSRTVHHQSSTMFLANSVEKNMENFKCTVPVCTQLHQSSLPTRGVLSLFRCLVLLRVLLRVVLRIKLRGWLLRGWSLMMISSWSSVGMIPVNMGEAAPIKALVSRRPNQMITLMAMHNGICKGPDTFMPNNMTTWQQKRSSDVVNPLKTRIRYVGPFSYPFFQPANRLVSYSNFYI